MGLSVHSDHVGGKQARPDPTILEAESRLEIGHPSLFLKDLHKGAKVVRVDPDPDTQRALPHDVVGGVAGQGGEPVVDLDIDAVLNAVDAHRIRTGLEDGPEKLFALPQSLFEPFAARHVDERADHHQGLA